MKLELKHLAPYLPHKLKFEINIFDQATVNGLMVGLNDKEIEFSGIRKTVTESFSYDLCIPIFHPLSDLKYYSNGLKHLGYRTDENNIFNLISDIKDKTADYKLMQMLFEEHIDVFGLIEKGRAIDINTLSTQNDG